MSSFSYAHRGAGRRYATARRTPSLPRVRRATLPRGQYRAAFYLAAAVVGAIFAGVIL